MPGLAPLCGTGRVGGGSVVNPRWQQVSGWIRLGGWLRCGERRVCVRFVGWRCLLCGCGVFLERFVVCVRVLQVEGF